MRKKNIVAVSIGVFVVASLALYFAVLKPLWVSERMAALKVDGVLLPKAMVIKNFQLTDNKGNAFTQDHLQGRWTMMFFGFTNCGMVCPTTLSALNKMYQTLEKELPAAALPQVVMVSVDPERDSVERMDGYMRAFNTHFVGTRAEMSQVVALEKQLHIISMKLQVEGGQDRYTIDHSAEIMIFNPQGKLQAYLHYPYKPERLVKDYKLIVETLS